jgi:hypothetical protein
MKIAHELSRNIDARATARIPFFIAKPPQKYLM